METVRALVLTERPAPGSLADALRMMEIDEPELRPRDVLIRVRASSINIDDIHMAEGTFYGGLPISPRPRFDKPVIPGSDVAGTIVAIGRSVRSAQVGQAVFGMQLPFRRKGAWAEFCAVDERWIAQKPEGLSYSAAAACGVAGLVALSATKALKMGAGMNLVIVGVTGGIGSISAQLAIQAGVNVIGVCGSGNVERAYQLGCSLVLDYTKGPWDVALRSNGIAAVDRVLDVVGGIDTEQRGRHVLKREGIFVTVVGPERFIGDRALGWMGILAVLARVGFRMLGSRLLGPRYVLTGPGAGGGGALAEVAAAVSAGVVPVIDSIVPFEQEPMRQALGRAVAHQNNGRIVIEMDNRVADR